MAHLREQDKDTVNMATLDAQSQHVKTSEESLVDEVSADAIGGTMEQLPMGYYRSLPFIGSVAALGLGSISTYLGWVLPSNLIGIINADLGPDPNYVWLATAWTLAVAVCSLLWGRLSDIFGRRWFLIGGNCLCLIGAIMGSCAQNVTTLIIGNAFVGLAVPAQLGFTIALAELVPKKARGYLNAGLFCASLPFATFGTVIARALATNTKAGWRWCYYLNVITTILAIALFFFFYHPPSFGQLHTKSSKIQVLKTLDYGGIFLFTAGLTLFLLSLSWGDQQYRRVSGEVLGTLLGGVALLGAFATWEVFGARNPLVPMRFFKNRGYIGIILTAAAGSMIYYSLSVLWPTQIAVMYTSDPIEIGWMSCAVGGSTLLGQLTAGLLVKRLGRQKIQLIFCAICMTSFIGAMASTSQHTRPRAVAFTCIGSFFVGYIELCSLTTAPLCLEDKDIGLATGILGSTRTGLAAIALSVYISVLNNKLLVNIPKYVIPAATSAGLPSSSIPALLEGFTSGSFDRVQGISPAIIAEAYDAYQTAYAKAFQVIYLISITFGAMAVIAAICSPNLEGNFNQSISRKLHGKGVDGLEVKQSAGEHAV